MPEIDPKFFSYVQYFTGRYCTTMIETDQGTSIICGSYNDLFLGLRLIRTSSACIASGGDVKLIVEDCTVKAALPTDKVIRKRFRETFRDFLSKPLRGTQMGLGGVLSL